MAIRSRKLFPDSSGTNNTNCSDYCTPDCPYNCVFPGFNNSTPAPPFFYGPFRPPSKPGLSPFLIAAIGLAGGCILLACYYILKFCRRLRGNSGNPGHHRPSSDGGEEEFIGENRVDHPIWYIATVGLQQSVINSIAVCKFKKGEGLIEGTECSVCLSEFREDETLRLLPKCSHAFHIRCVDTWLRSHTNCPLCRAHIVTDIVVSAAGNREEEDLGRNENTQMEITGMNVGFPAESEVSGERAGSREREEQTEVGKEGVESGDSNGSDELTQRNQERAVIIR